MTLILAHTSGLISGDRKLLGDDDPRPEALGEPKIWRDGCWLLGWHNVAAFGPRMRRIFRPGSFAGTDLETLEAAAQEAAKTCRGIWSKIDVLAVRCEGSVVYKVEAKGAYPIDGDWCAMGSCAAIGLAAARGVDRGRLGEEPLPFNTVQYAHQIAAELNTGCGGGPDILSGPLRRCHLPPLRRTK